MQELFCLFADAGYYVDVERSEEGRFISMRNVNYSGWFYLIYGDLCYGFVGSKSDGAREPEFIQH